MDKADRHVPRALLSEAQVFEDWCWHSASTPLAKPSHDNPGFRGWHNTTWQWAVWANWAATNTKPSLNLFLVQELFPSHAGHSSNRRMKWGCQCLKNCLTAHKCNEEKGWTNGGIWESCTHQKICAAVAGAAADVEISFSPGDLSLKIPASISGAMLSVL